MSVNLPSYHPLTFPENGGLNQPDVRWKVFEYTNFDSLKQLACVSKSFYDMVHSEIFHRYFLDPAAKKGFVINNPKRDPKLALYDSMFYIPLCNWSTIKVFSIYNYDFTKKDNLSLSYFPSCFRNIEKFTLNNCILEVGISILAQFTLKNLQFVSNKNNQGIPFNFSFIEFIPSLTELNLFNSDNDQNSWKLFTRKHFNFTFKSGSQYEGAFVNGIKHGKGKLTDIHSNIYEGDFENGLIAKGKFTKEGDIYEGPFKHGSPDGKGTLTCRNGDKYEGDFVNGRYHGIGEITYSNGDIYVGDYFDGLKHGKGKLTYCNGDTYEGEYQGSFMHGKGKYIFNGHIYEGDYFDGLKHGKGKLTYCNGDTYEGEYQGGLMHGKGTLTHINAYVYEGDFVNGWKSGHGKKTYCNGDTYEGECQGSFMHGKGKYIFNGHIYEGDFVKDRMQGKGTLIYPNGDQYIGNFINDLPEGQGTYIDFATGKKYFGYFKEGHFLP